MKGLELARAFFEECALPEFEKEFPDFLSFAAAGLVGEGSECFGFDDEISRDHDWGPGFCVWLDDPEMERYGARLSQIYEQLPASYMGYRRYAQKEAAGRVGILSTREFYSRFTGMDRPPESVLEWRWIPEQYLAVATNGQVFTDERGNFTSFREKLLAFYPDDVVWKKMAARCVQMGQAGQYNYPRCANRKETVAAMEAKMLFIDAAISMVFLLNRRYTPFYKWKHRALRDLPVLGGPCYTLTDRIARDDGAECLTDIEELCRLIADHLRSAGLTDSSSDFMPDLAPSIQNKIRNEQIRSIPLIAE